MMSENSDGNTDPDSGEESNDMFSNGKPIFFPSFFQNINPTM